MLLFQVQKLAELRDVLLLTNGEEPSEQNVTCPFKLLLPKPWFQVNFASIVLNAYRSVSPPVRVHQHVHVYGCQYCMWINISNSTETHTHTHRTYAHTHVWINPIIITARQDLCAVARLLASPCRCVDCDQHHSVYLVPRMYWTGTIASYACVLQYVFNTSTRILY